MHMPVNTFVSAGVRSTGKASRGVVLAGRCVHVFKITICGVRVTLYHSPAWAMHAQKKTMWRRARCSLWRIEITPDPIWYSELGHAKLLLSGSGDLTYVICSFKMKCTPLISYSVKYGFNGFCCDTRFCCHISSYTQKCLRRWGSIRLKNCFLAPVQPEHKLSKSNYHQGEQNARFDTFSCVYELYRPNRRSEAKIFDFRVVQLAQYFNTL